MGTRKHKLGILGCGGIMRGTYTPIIRRLSDRVEVAAVCDPNPQNLSIAAQLFPAARPCADAVQLLETPGLNAVMVLTAERANAAMATLAMQAGLAVYLEKPPAISLMEFDALLDCETRTDVRLFVAFNRRHTPLLNGIELSNTTTRHVRGRMSRLRRRLDHFPTTAIHLIDSAQFFFGDFFSEAEVRFFSYPTDSWQVHGTWPGGVTCELEFFPASGTNCEYLVFESGDHMIDIQFPNSASAFPCGRLLRITSDGREQSLPPPPGTVTAVPNDDTEQMGYAPAFRDFVAALDSGDPPAPIWQLSTCHATIAIMETMTQQPHSPVHLFLNKS
ncbi:Gfo/Idh/MocA family protein [Geminisphaera colitermitum]|uniref:Gfo/Idh/MocA family protein n=1 Tax=Geminisphaera colitermitum TaxID=1148786 RepID=UPI000158C854|nr:Gfo/Idh/MocA family oxidoreductase [Geminisphaera colitermitum]